MRPWPPARSGPTPSPSRRLSRVGDRRERQKRHQQVHFYLLTNTNWLLNRSYKNGLLIFGETPGFKSFNAYLIGFMLISYHDLAKTETDHTFRLLRCATCSMRHANLSSPPQTAPKLHHFQAQPALPLSILAGHPRSRLGLPHPWRHGCR